MNMWFTKLIKQFFFWLDKIVFNFIPAIYDLLITIARTSVLTQADIADMADRIYKLLAIFMIFKVTLSLITYVVNPDDFSDKSKGVAKLGSNIIISLALLILTPYLFSYAYQIQTIILEDNSLATLVFGGEEGDKEKSSFFNKAGDEMAYTTMGAFFSPNLSLGDLHECSRITEKNDNGDVVFNSACKSALGDILGTDSVNLKNYVAGVELRNLGLTFRQDLALATNEENTEFVMEYKFIFSTVVGVVVILLLINFCMDVAVRSLKLAFLQLIAPVPILSYVDPKSGKDGMFKKWYEMCFKTFLSLFIRLLALYFSVYIISKVSALNLVDVIDGSYQTNALVAVFIIIGALMFAKDLPKILEGLGIKLDGGAFNLNPLRKIEKEALGGKILKKPNDMLAKAGKAVLKSPFSAMSLGGRKLLAGIDSAASGKGFANGAKNVKGGLSQGWDKFMEKNMPNLSKRRKERKEARDEMALMHNKWAKGEEIAKKLGNDASFSSLNGLSDRPYRDAGFSGSFLQSKVALDKATEKKKIIDQIYSARQMGKTGAEIRDELTKAGIKFADYGVNEAVFGSDTLLKKEYEKAGKEVSGREQVHEIMRKGDTSQAALEDSIKFRKNNSAGDPTITSSSGERSYSLYEQTSNQFIQNNGGLANNSGSSAGSPPNAGVVAQTTNSASPSASQDYDAIVDAERERAKNIHEYEIEKLRKQIDELKENLEERLEIKNRTVSNYEKVVDSLESQKRNPIDTASREGINKQIEEYKEKIEQEQIEIKNLKDEYERKIKYLEERIALLTNGV